MGYKLEEVENMDGGEFSDDVNKLFRMKDTEIYLSMVQFYLDEYYEEHWFEDMIVVGIAASAHLAEPSLVGNECLPVVETDIIYWPNGYLHHYGDANFISEYFESDDSVITEDTIIGLTLKTDILDCDWQMLTRSVFEERVKIVAESQYGGSG